MRINLNISFAAVLIFFCILLCIPKQLIAQIDFSNKTFKDSVDYKTFSKTKGVKIERRVVSRDGIPFYDPDEVCQFFKYVYFDNAEFHSSAVFTGTQFESPSSFMFTHFMTHSDFDQVKFDTVFFMGAKFYADANFTMTNFKSFTTFRGAYFGSSTNFSKTHFYSNVDFSHAYLGGVANFYFSEFDSETLFQFAQLESRIEFVLAKFRSDVNFENADFGTYASFGRTEFYGNVRFAGAVLPDSLDFGNIAEITKNIDLTNCNLNAHKKKQDKDYRCKIDLYGSDIDKISINMELFELWFPNETYEQKISVYEKVLKKLEKDGFKESYKILDIEYRKLKYREQGLMGVLLATFLEWWWNFGYNPERVFMWSALLLGIFFVLTMCFFHRFYNIYDIEFLHLEKWEEEKRTLIKHCKYFPFGRFTLYLVRRAFHVIIYTAIVFFGIKLDIEKFRPKPVTEKGKYYAALAVLLSCYFIGLFCTAYIINIIFK